MSRFLAFIAISLWLASNHGPELRAESGFDKAAYQKKLFNLLDANNDGKVSETEFALGTLWGDFQQCDTNNDEKITRDEYNAHPGTTLAWFQICPKGKDHFTFGDLTKNRQIIRYMHREWKIVLSELKMDKNSRHITKADLPDLSN